MKKIGVLTSGGDAPGMNAAVRAVTRAALAKGMEVVGIQKGYVGLLEREYFDMTARSVSGIIQRGGTCLYTARCPEFRNMEGVMKGVDEQGFLGLFAGGLTAGAIGTSAALIFGYLASLVFKPKMKK